MYRHRDRCKTVNGVWRVSGTHRMGRQGTGALCAPDTRKVWHIFTNVLIITASHVQLAAISTISTTPGVFRHYKVAQD